eukprot:gene12767-26919_t
MELDIELVSPLLCGYEAGFFFVDFETRGARNAIEQFVYVDDLLITCEDKYLLSGVILDINRLSVSTKVNREYIHSYVGMTFDFNKVERVKIELEGYIDTVNMDISEDLAC